MDKTSFQRIIDEIVKKTSLESVKTELNRVRDDIRSLSQHPQAKRAREEAEKRSKRLYSMLNEAQKQLDKEVEKATTKLWKSTSDIDATIKTYRKKAAEEFAKLEELIGKKIKGSANSSSSASTSKKTSSTKAAGKKKSAAGKKKSTAVKSKDKPTAKKTASKVAGKKTAGKKKTSATKSSTSKKSK